ncbi:MAG: YigZ family protein [Clostridia bacterium]|nr:YigZ family protein [Clostridia bacterium]
MSDFYIISKNGYGEIVEKKSKFIANVFPVSNEQEAAAHIEAIRKKYWDARHNCHAFVIGAHDETQRCSDDGEPSGTAGKPILEVIHGNKLHNCLIVVTRYFGGILLGTGGLVRAYTQAAQAGLADATVQQQIEGRRIHLTFDYTNLAKLQHIAGQLKLTLDNVQYTDKIEAEVMADIAESEEFINSIVESTAGRVMYEVEDGVFIYKDVSSLGKK